MVSSYTTNKAFEKPANGDYVDTWNIPVNGDWDIADRAFGGTYSIALTNANVNLTQANCQNVRIRLTGLISSNITINFPASVSGFFIVQNLTTGTYNVTLASSGGGAGTVITEQGKTVFIFTDGTNIFYADDSRLSLTAGTGITITGTTNVTISLTTPVAVANGGTGSGTASGARANLSAAWTGQQIIAGAGLTGGGDLSADRTLSVPAGGITGAMLASGATVTNLGYTPVNKAGDTMTGALQINLASAGALKLNTSNTLNGLQFLNGVTVVGQVGGNSTYPFLVQTASSGNAIYCDQSGNFTAVGNVTAYSDMNLKEQILTIGNGLDKVKQMRGVYYTMKESQQRGVGVIAQEMQRILPEVVMEGADGTLSVAYGNIVGILIEAIKDLSNEVKALKEKV